jgi:hypothetical protein
MTSSDAPTDPAIPAEPPVPATPSPVYLSPSERIDIIHIQLDRLYAKLCGLQKRDRLYIADLETLEATVNNVEKVVDESLGHAADKLKFSTIRVFSLTIAIVRKKRKAKK